MAFSWPSSPIARSHLSPPRRHRPRLRLLAARDGRRTSKQAPGGGARSSRIFALWATSASATLIRVCVRGLLREARGPQPHRFSPRARDRERLDESRTISGTTTARGDAARLSLPRAIRLSPPRPVRARVATALSRRPWRRLSTLPSSASGGPRLVLRMRFLLSLLAVIRDPRAAQRRRRARRGDDPALIRVYSFCHHFFLGD